MRPLKIFLGCALIAIGLAALGAFRMLFLTVAIGLIGGILLEPLIRLLQQRFRLPHGVSVGLTALFILSALGGLGYAAYRLIAGQVTHLADQGPQIRDKLVEKLEAVANQFSAFGLDTSQFNPGEYLQRIGSALMKLVTVSAEGLSFVLIIFMLALFIAANFRSYGAGCLTLFPPERRPRVAQLTKSSVQLIRRWFFSQVIVVVISASITAVAMLLIGLDYWLLIAALTVILDFVPFLGAIITGAVAGLLTLGTEPDKIWWVLLAYVLIQQIETDLLLPLVMKGRIRLPEAHLLVFVLLMAAAFGVIGIFLAPPIFAVLHHLYCEAYIPWVEGQGRKNGAVSAKP